MKIGIIFTGGTIGSVVGERGIGTDDSAPHDLFARYRAATGDGTVFRVAQPYTILSERLNFSYITRLAHSIREMSEDCEALIVTHGTDTLQYTAAALSYILGLSFMPVVLVSSNYILSDPRANGLANFCAAVRFLRETNGAHGVYVSYQNTGEPVRIYRATRLLSHHALADDIYAIGSALAEEREGNICPISHYTEAEDAQKPLPSAHFSSVDGHVQFLRAYPGMIYPRLDESVFAVLIETYHSGTLRTTGGELATFAARAKQLQIPIFLVGITGEIPYESASVFGELGLISLPRLSPVAAYMKLCLALSANLDPREVLPLPLGGDLS